MTIRAIGWAVALAALFAAAPAAHAQTVSKGVAKTLAAAQTASKSRRWGECLAKLRDAEGSGGLSAYDSFVINELRGYCALSSGDSGTAIRAYETNLGSQYASNKGARTKALMQLHYNSRNYPKAIEYGRQAQKGGFADGDVNTLLAQSFYQQGDFKQTRAFTADLISQAERRGQPPKQNYLQLNLNACIKLKDTACETAGFEKLVTYYPNPEGWASLMQSMLKGGPDVTLLNSFRLATEVGAMRRGEDYTEMAQLALERGLPGEAQSVMETAFARKVFTDQRDIDRNMRLLNSAKSKVPADKAGLAAADRAAAAAASADDDLRVAQSFMSYGQNAQAVAAAQRAVKKGNGKTPGEANLVLGLAQFKSGDKAGAVKSFKAVKGDPSLERVAKLWSLRAQ
ncbi:MAG: hypothetical protein EBS39_11915 [Gammaproteobacteria bacterium]|nr:hypothetical protein [Gammaproteobacteria bacterium]